MRKIIFFPFILSLIFISTASAYQGTFEYVPGGSTWSDEWTLHPTQSGGNAISASLYIDPTSGSTSLYIADHWSNTIQYITLNELQTLGYVSFILRDNVEDQYEANCWHNFVIYDQSNTALVSFYLYGIPDNRKLEFVPNGNYIDFYVNGVLRESKVNPGITSSTPIRYGFNFMGGDNPGVKIDDFTTEGSIIGSPLLFTESVSTFPVTWSAQLMRSYPDNNFSVSLYSLTNTNNAGKIADWSIPDGDNASTAEYGYITANRVNLLGLNFGLYLLEMTRDGLILTDTYFYYDNSANPQGFSDILFLAESSVNTDIKDEDNNGGEISGGSSVYLYPSENEDGIYNFSYEILETPASFTAELTKVYNTSDLNGSYFTFSGLAGQCYYVTVNEVGVGSTLGADTWNYTLSSWDSDSYSFSFDPDYTVPGVWGYIKNSETQNPLKSATVKISNNSETFYLYTDSNGQYYKTIDMAPGPYTVIASKSGYTTSNPYNITAINGTTTRQDIFLDPESGAGVYYQSHDVTFTVLEYWYSSTGLPGVSYAVYDDENESVKNGTTGSKGTFTVTEMDAGKNYTFILTYNNQTYTEYLEPGLTEYNLVLNKEGIVHQYFNSWLNLTYAENSNNATILYTSNKTASEASFIVTASNGTIVQSNTLNTTSGTFLFNFTDGDYILQFNIEASDGSTASQAWSISSPPEVTLFPASYPTWLKNTLFVTIIIIFLLAFGKSKNDIACGSVAVLTSLGYYFEWLSCGFNFVVLIWIIAIGAIYLHYKRTGAVG